MMGNVILLLLSIAICLKSSSAVDWRKLIAGKVLQAHRYDDELQGELDWSMEGEMHRPHIVCYSEDFPGDQVDPSKVVFVDKFSREICYLELHYNTSLPSEGVLSSAPLPAAFKIDPSVVSYLNEEDDWRTKVSPTTTSDIVANNADSAPFSLSVQFHPYSSAQALLDKIHDRLRSILSQVPEKDIETGLKEVKRGFHFVARHLRANYPSLVHGAYELFHKAECNLANILASLHVMPQGFEVAQAHLLSRSCLTSLTMLYAASGDVLSVSIEPAAQLMNFEGRGHIMTGEGGVEPYRDSGLTGKGQICGIADSGLDDTSCFFIDNSDAYPTLATDRKGVLEPFRRKVIQYIPFADAMDEEGGHGTHVSGSVAGSSLSDFSDMDGVAPEAKITFFDLGVTDKAFLKVPPLAGLFLEAYRSGARIHTNSWGNLGGLYGFMSRDVDKFTFDHPDILILFAGGNSGAFGRRTIISPGNAKNALTVGAGQIRSVFHDNPLDEEDYSVALFSSIGPTWDGRLKPDVIAPGDFIMSAYAASPENQTAAFDSSWKGHEHCAVHQMSGTSMATPLTAGAALLVRQYFMDRHHWATICQLNYSTCTNGPFTPSGYLLKTVFLHAGSPVHRYSDPDYDIDGSVLRSFPLSSPPDPFQGYGQVVLRNVLPLNRPGGLHESLSLYLWDSQQLTRNDAIEVLVRIDSKFCSAGSENEDNLVCSSPLKVTLAWYDPPHVLGFSSKLLLQDLDLIVESPSEMFYLGNKRDAVFSKSDFEAKPQVVYPDDHNPNEQIYIPRPTCRRNEECVYRVVIQSYQLPVNQYQKFALVITVNGTATEPTRTTSRISFGNHPIAPTSSPISAPISAPAPRFIKGHSKSIHLNADLPGGQSTNSSIFVDHCALLETVEVKLNFIGDAASDSWPYNLELTLVDPMQHGLAVGGIDVSVGKASVVTEWPGDWMHHRNGSYHTEIDVKEAGLVGVGIWTIYLMNSWSSAGNAKYDITVILHYDTKAWKNETVCDLWPVPSPRPTFSSLEVTDYIDTDSLQKLTSKKLPFSQVMLGVNASPSGILHDRIVIGVFEQKGWLDSIMLDLNAFEGNTSVRGSNAWLLDVIVTAPNGLVAQVGGLDWLSTDDRFYVRRWPDPWIGRYSSQNWVSKRDVHAAGLMSIPLLLPLPPISSSTAFKDRKASKQPTTWKVELAVGFPFGSRQAISYSGSTTLFFRPLLVTPPISADAEYDASKMFAEWKGELFSHSFALLLTVVVILLVYFTLRKVQKLMEGEERVVEMSSWALAEDREDPDEERAALGQYGSLSR